MLDCTVRVDSVESESNKLLWIAEQLSSDQPAMEQYSAALPSSVSHFSFSTIRFAAFQRSQTTTSRSPPLLPPIPSLSLAMFSRSSSLANCRASVSNAVRFTAPAPIRRGYAAAATTTSPSSPRSSHEFETAEAHGVKYANRKTLLPTARLTVVAKAGSRHQPASGLAEVLEKFAYKVRSI